jgi:hypothetical protein
MLRISRIRAIAALAAVTGAAALACLAASASVASPRLSASTQKLYVAAKGCTGHTLEPGTVILACADANLYVSGLDYSSYGASSAPATGTVHVNECKPNCAAGKFRTYPAKLTFFDVVKCSDGRRYYARAKYSYEAKYGKGTADIEPTTLKCESS